MQIYHGKKLGMLCLCTLIFQNDIHKDALKKYLRDQLRLLFYLVFVICAFINFFYQIPISYCKFIMPKALKWDMLCLCTLIFQYDIHKML